nr:hypothetical protein [Delftia tsuruhatensis]
MQILETMHRPHGDRDQVMQAFEGLLGPGVQGAGALGVACHGRVVVRLLGPPLLHDRAAPVAVAQLPLDLAGGGGQLFGGAVEVGVELLAGLCDDAWLAENFAVDIVLILVIYKPSATLKLREYESTLSVVGASIELLHK